MGSKKTKLAEKPVRIPDTRPGHWEEAISQYLREIEQLNKEPARSHRFGMLLQQLLGIEPNFIENYSAGIEQSLNVRQKDRILRGEPDNLFGNIVIEFEGNIPRNRSQAEDQLRRYLAILWSQEPPHARIPYLCIATDGVRFLTYSPTLANGATADVSPDNVRLNVLEEADWAKLKPHEVFYWLDRYFLRKEILHPTSETIVRDFGVRSHAFQTTTSALLSHWRETKGQSAFAVIYNCWEKYLRIVYGSDVAGDELFVRHTYLATLAKLMSWMRITESTYLPDEAEIVEMLEGRSFKAQGIENFIEEDFFSWLARQGAAKVGVALARWLFSLLQNYNLRELSEDVLKSLYQELVDPETRHDLGEFYTPDWLAHRMVRKLLDGNPPGSMLDPACGSGTFLYLAIREKRERLRDSLNTLHHILDSVYGADVHPLAVIIAKTNYILALGDLLKKRKGKIRIPIYLADTIKLPELVKQAAVVEINGVLVQQMPGYRVELDGNEIHLPERLVEDVALYDPAIELAKDFALQNKRKPISPERFRNFLIAQHFFQAEEYDLVRALFSITEALKYLIDSDRDTIWAFVLKNIYKPLFFKCKFDFIMGNPPWIAFRFMEPAYQEFMKRQITKEYQLLTGRGELITHLEVAALFLVRSADLYLKIGGMIAFVLPKSIFAADQHDGLRKRLFKMSEDSKNNLFWYELWDCEDITPLFNWPACVLLAEKREAAEIKYPISGQILLGKLERKNASLKEAERLITVTEVEFSLHLRGKRSFWSSERGEILRVGSCYKTRFAQGATILPRSFWFVRVKHSPLGFNPDLPPLESIITSKAGPVKDYKDIKIEGNAESLFLYSTLLGDDLLPFGYRNNRIILLPIEPQGDHHRIINSNEASQLGFLHLARWLVKAEKEWTNVRGPKAGRMGIYERLDRVRSLSRQNPQTKYRVVYPNFQRMSLASVVKTEANLSYEVNQQRMGLRGFVVDHALYHYETSNLLEAHYLCACLNSSVIDMRLGALRRKNQKTRPNVHKKIFDVAPIPDFDASNASHRRLAELGRECSAKVKRWLASGAGKGIKSIGRLRGMVRQMLKEELKEIDALVKKILG